MKKSDGKDSISKSGKRSFSNVSEEKCSSTRITRSKLAKNKSSKIHDFFRFLPENAIKTILSFLSNSTLKNLKFINRDFHLYVSQMYTILYFENKNEIPFESLESILKTCLKPEEIRFGQMKNIKANDFLHKIVKVMNLQELKVLDFGRFSGLTDEILIKCLEKTNMTGLMELDIPYSCQITNKALLFIEENVQNLQCFHLDSKYSRVRNKNLDQSTLARIVIKNKDLTELFLETINCEFLNTLSQNSFSSEQLAILKIRNLEMNDFPEIKNILALNSCKNMVCFTLMEIFVKQILISEDNDDILDNLQKLFRSMENLKHLKIGHFTTPALLDIISDNVDSLEMFKVVSEFLEIEDLEGFFFNCSNLMTLQGKVGAEYNFIHLEKKKIIFIF